MASYNVLLTTSASRELRNLDPEIRRRVVGRIDDLKKNPFSHGAIQLHGGYSPPLYRVRVGDYRIVYTVNNSSLTVTIHGLGPRDKIYNQF